MEFCLFFEKIEPDTPANQIGYKAYNLASLLRTGFHVPKAFCVTTGAYAHHLNINQLGKPILRILNNGGLSNNQKAKQMQEVISLAPLPDELDRSISQAYAELTRDSKKNIPLAVRSSGTAEDTPSHSFAGQYATFLNVSGEEALIEKIKACWASLWSERAISYQSQVPTDPPKMAVIVQHMIPAEISGVTFTTNPVTGKNEIIVEAASGLGESLVSGITKPKSYKLDKQINGAVSAPLSQDLLSQKQLKDLQNLVINIENHFGQPQDIEWALANNDFHVLQSRPITALSETQTQQGNNATDLEELLQRSDNTGCHIWTKDNVGEVIPGAVTPLSWTVIEPLGNNAFRSLLGRVGIPYNTETSLFARFEGQVYFNLSKLLRTLRLFFISRGINRKSFLLSIGNKMKSNKVRKPVPSRPKIILF